MNSIVRTSFVAVLVAIGITASPSSDANAKQCVWNKGGYILKARWYNSADIVATVDENGDYKAAIEPDAQPVQVDQWPVAQGRCTRGENENKDLTVVLSVVDGNIASQFVKIALGAGVAVVGAGTTAAAATGCTLTGVTCPLVGVAIAGTATAAGGAVSAIPDAKEVFYIGKPSKTHWLDAWGTIWQPVTGPGGRI